jgi:hypothetical protein
MYFLSGFQQQQIAAMSQQVVEAERKAASYLKRHSKVQVSWVRFVVYMSHNIMS